MSMYPPKEKQAYLREGYFSMLCWCNASCGCFSGISFDLVFAHGTLCRKEFHTFPLPDAEDIT